MSEKYIRKRRLSTFPDVETFFWIGVNAFLSFTGIITPVSGFLHDLGVIGLNDKFTELILGGIPIALLVLFNNIWLWRSEDQMFSERIPAKLLKALFFQNFVSIGTYIGLTLSLVIIITQEIVNAFIFSAWLFSLLWLLSIIVSLCMIVLKGILSRKVE